MNPRDRKFSRDLKLGMHTKLGVGWGGVGWGGVGWGGVGWGGGLWMRQDPKIEFFYVLK